MHDIAAMNADRKEIDAATEATHHQGVVGIDRRYLYDMNVFFVERSVISEPIIDAISS